MDLWRVRRVLAEQHGKPGDSRPSPPDGDPDKAEPGSTINTRIAHGHLAPWELFRAYLLWHTDADDDAEGSGAGGLRRVLREKLVALLRGCKPNLGEGAADGALLHRAAELLSELMADWQREFGSLLDAWRGAVDPSGEDAGALSHGEMVCRVNAVYYRCKALSDETTIETLADGQWLPRYGFPIGVLRLQVLDVERVQRGGEGRTRLRTREEDT